MPKGRQVAGIPPLSAARGREGASAREEVARGAVRGGAFERLRLGHGLEPFAKPQFVVDTIGGGIAHAAGRV